MVTLPSAGISERDAGTAAAIPRSSGNRTRHGRIPSLVAGGPGEFFGGAALAFRGSGHEVADRLELATPRAMNHAVPGGVPAFQFAVAAS